MAHVNLYDAVLTEKQVIAQKKWMLNGAKPVNLVNPASYLEEAAKNPKYVMIGAFGEGDEPGLVENDVEGGEQSEGEEDAIEQPEVEEDAIEPEPEVEPAPKPKPAKKKGSSGMLIAVGFGVALVGVGVAVVASRGKRTQKNLGAI